METILILLHVEKEAGLAKLALETLGAAKDAAGASGAKLMVGLVGENLQAAANQIAGCGASRFLGVEGVEFGQPRYGSDVAAAEAICRAAGATVVIAPATSRWNRVAAGLAHRLGGRADTHVTNLTSEGGGLTISRWYYRQRMEAAMRCTQRPWVIALEAGCHAPWKGDAGTAKIEAVKVSLTEAANRTTVTGVKAPASDQQTIRPDAELLFVAGAGWTKKQADGQTHAPEAESLIRGFLQHTKASLGSSKSLVDLSKDGQAVLTLMTHLNQVGQTGATPRHPKGLSTCCHGEEPHAVGWRFINERRAVNLDPNCGWARGKADVLYVADAFEVMRKVNALLAAKQGK
ncbi:MAG TPA: electron transfer flavoprotein subunit alpha [Verrucomicrobiae bacterium]|nr:electron transfer flavoprotein subunit alpha [Verrucomicrobiae bacterium]